LRGGATIGQLPPSTDWNTMHDTYALQVRSIPSFTLEDTREFAYGDGVTLENNSTAWTIRGVHFKYIRDDCVQNDWLNGGLIDSSFFEGCYVGISARPFTTTQDGSENLVVVKNSLFWLQDMDQGFDGPGHGGFFKWSPGGPMVSLYNNVYRVDSRSTLGTHTLGPPAGKVHGCANNVMIWLGAGPFPESLPSCYTLLTGAAGLAYWNNAVTSWKTNHANVLSDVGPPIVSLYSPSASTTLIGTVNLTATAVDDRAVVGVQFQLNWQALGPEVATESPTTKFTLSWDSHALPDGSYTLSAIARDAAGHLRASPGLAVAINNTVSAAQSAVAATPTAIAAGTEISIITVTVHDYSGNPVSGATVTLSATGSGNTITQPAGPTDTNGVATGSLSSTAAGSKTVMAVADGVTLGQQPIVTVIAGPADPGASSVSANPDSIIAGSAPSTITVTVRDGFGNPVSGSTVVLTATGAGNSLIQPAGPTNSSGVATGTLGSTVAETKTISATAGGTPITQTATVTVTPAPAGAVSHTLLTSGNNAVNQRIYTTAAIAPGPNTLVTVAVLDHRTPAAISPTLSGGGMTSWSVVATVDFDTIGGALRRLTIFRAMSASPGSGPITITFTNSVSNVQWIVSQWDGVDTSGVNGAGAIGQIGSSRANAGNGLAVTLLAFGNVNHVAYGVFGVNKNVPAITPGAGFTKIDEQASSENTPGDLFAEWTTNNNAITATWSNLRGAALGVEIKARVGP
jgi:protocatechuate 3,4-dioxygenase beta subunit